jgi:hypothetical protein
MALAKNSVVIPRTSILGTMGQQSYGFGGGGLPILGTVESIGPAVVCWENGTKVSYATETELIEIVTASVNAAAFYHRRVRLVAGFAEFPADPAGQSTSEGLVIGIFTLKTAISGVVDFLVIQFSANDIAIFPAVSCTVVA